MKTNIENNQETLYNNNESESGINGERAQNDIDQRGIWRNNETMREQEQGRNTTDIENTQRENISSRVRENNVSEKTIEQEYKDNETIKKTIEYAKQNKIKNPNRNIIIVDGGYNDTITDRIIQRIGNARNAESGMQVYSSDVQ